MTSEFTGAKLICESLLRENVEVIFGIPGGAILPFYDALWHYPQIYHVLMRHEQAASHAAVGYARSTGKTGVCISTSGPGATNLITGLTDAKMDSTPIVAITGQVARPFLGTEAFQECDTTGMASPLVKKTYLVMDVKDLPNIIHEAFEVAQSGRPGPVLIDIPKDVQAEVTTPVSHHAPIVSPLNNGGQDETLLRHAAKLINDAKKPLIIAGNGIHLSGASNALVQFVERTNIPVINTLHGTGGFPRSHRLAMGMLGMHGLFRNNIAVGNADLILAIGMRFDDRVIGRPGSFAPNARIIHVEIEPEQIGRNVPTDIGLIGDAKSVLNNLMPYVDDPSRDEWIRELSDFQAEHPSPTVPDNEGLTPQFVLNVLNAHLHRQEDPLVVTGVGQHQMWSAQFLEIEHPSSFITSGGLGVMGFEIPAAIGAQVGRPKAHVWSVAGDGGFQMTLQELATIAQEKLPIKFVIMNNGYHGMVRQWQELFYDNHYKSVSIPGPDYVKLASAFGIQGEEITQQESVQASFERASNHKGPYVLDMRIVADENVYPMVPPGASLAETVEDPRIATYSDPLTTKNSGTVSYP